MIKTTLIFSDAHIEANENLDRFRVLGDFIIKNKPDNIVQMGDFLTFDSISHFDLRKPLKQEGRRIKEELTTARAAYTIIQDAIQYVCYRDRCHKKKVYNPRRVWIEGNHEERAETFVQYHPQLEGLFDYKQAFNPMNDGWEIVPYREYADVEGILMTHAPMNGMNKPVGGRHSLKNNIRNHNASLCYGHSHAFGVESDGFFGSDSRNVAVNCGCFFDIKESIPAYAQGSALVSNWWAGIVLLKHWGDDGDFDVESISLERLMRGDW